MSEKQHNREEGKSVSGSFDTSKNFREGRRRFLLKGAAVTAPAIMTVASRPVLGGYCTGSALASGTHSGPNQPQACYGCSHGRWKSKHGWPSGCQRDNKFGDYFTAPSDMTVYVWSHEDGEDREKSVAELKLIEVLELGGGGVKPLLREAVAALLNAMAFGPNGSMIPGTYVYNENHVIMQVNMALAAGDWGYAQVLENFHDDGIFGDQHGTGDVICPL